MRKTSQQDMQLKVGITCHYKTAPGFSLQSVESAAECFFSSRKTVFSGAKLGFFLSFSFPIQLDGERICGSEKLDALIVDLNTKRDLCVTIKAEIDQLNHLADRQTTANHETSYATGGKQTEHVVAM